MRVITLERLCDFIFDKVGKNQKIDTVSFNEKELVVIHDEDKWFNVDSIENMRKQDGVHCVIELEKLCETDSETPWIKSREALSGDLIVDGVTPSDDDLRTYMYKV